MKIDWRGIDSVFLDMDGTLLDLNFDNHFWQEHVPKRYAERHGMDTGQAKQEVYPRFKQAEGSIDWYCLDFWSRQLDLDIPALKREVAHLIAVHPNVEPFLLKLRERGKRVVLVTNAHIKSLSLKMEYTQLHGHFDKLVCSHEYGIPKEDEDFWQRLQSGEVFDPQRTLLIDDSLPVLRSARAYGIRHLLAVHKPDTQRPKKDVEEFDAIHDFAEIFPATRS